MRFLFHRGRAFHATVVVGDVEENEFGDVDESSPVVFLDSSEGQVDEVEKMKQREEPVMRRAPSS